MFSVLVVSPHIGNGDAELVVWNDGDEGAISKIEVERFSDMPSFARSFLWFDASLLDEFDERSGGAIGDRRLIGIHLNKSIVNAQAD